MSSMAIGHGMGGHAKTVKDPKVGELARRVKDARTTDAAPASGIISLEFGAPREGFYWLIERITTYSPGAFNEVFVIVGEFDPNVPQAKMVDYSKSPSSDISDQNSPIFVDSGEKVTMLYRGGAAGDRGYATMQYRNLTD